MEEVDSGGFYNFLFSPFCSDIMFEVGSLRKQIPAHKIILAARSSYFHRLFQKEVSSISLVSVKVEIFEMFLNFLYTNRLPFYNLITFEQLQELDNLAK